jgi:hypothetical protein
MRTVPDAGFVLPAIYLPGYCNPPWAKILGFRPVSRFAMKPPQWDWLEWWEGWLRVTVGRDWA